MQYSRKVELQIFTKAMKYLLAKCYQSKYSIIYGIYYVKIVAQFLLFDEINTLSILLEECRITLCKQLLELEMEKEG